MIKTLEIDPFKSKDRFRTLEDIATIYHKIFHKDSNPKSLLEDFIKKKQHKDYKIAQPIEIEILDHLYQNFDEILVLKPQVLQSKINFFSSKGWHEIIYVNDKTTDFGIALLDIYGYKDRFRSGKRRGVWLAKLLNIKACPYCNAQYTVVTDISSGDELLKFQLDHFFPKSIYPYLSISLYNLIPCCSNCNITKSSRPLSLKKHYHPYFLNLANYAKFKLKYDPDPSKLTVNTVFKQDLTIEFIPKHGTNHDFVKEHDSIYNITGIYNRHQDIAEELLMTAIIHTNGLIKNHMEIKGLFPDENSYYRYVLRNYYLEKDIHKRPLSKFTQDIAKQLKLI